MNAQASARASTPAVDAVIGRNIDFLIWRAREKKATTAAGLGISPQSLSQKLSGQRPWTASEIQSAASRFRVSIDDLFKMELPGLDSNQEPIGSRPARIVSLDAHRAARKERGA